MKYHIRPRLWGALYRPAQPLAPLPHPQSSPPHHPSTPPKPQEDADLFSINYLHFGAPKVWYCVAPSHRKKFERMCQSLYPELHRACPAFLRHKDVMLSPAMLKTHGVKFSMVSAVGWGRGWAF